MVVLCIFPFSRFWRMSKKVLVKTVGETGLVWKWLSDSTRVLHWESNKSYIAGKSLGGHIVYGSGVDDSSVVNWAFLHGINTINNTFTYNGEVIYYHSLLFWSLLKCFQQLHILKTYSRSLELWSIWCSQMSSSSMHHTRSEENLLHMWQYSHHYVNM